MDALELAENEIFASLEQFISSEEIDLEIQTSLVSESGLNEKEEHSNENPHTSLNEFEQTETGPEESIVQQFEKKIEEFHVGIAEQYDPDIICDCLKEIRNLLDAYAFPVNNRQWEAYREMGEHCVTVGWEQVLWPALKTARREGRDSEVRELTLCAVEIGKQKEVSSFYSGYLKQGLSKSLDFTMEQLTTARTRRRLQTQKEYMEYQKLVESEEEDMQPHVTSLSSILSEAATALGRLQETGLHSDVEPSDVQTCQPGVKAVELHELAAKKAVEVLEWYGVDAGLPLWSDWSRSADMSALLTEVKVELLDFVVDELSYICQLTTRYLDYAAASVGLIDQGVLFGQLQSFIGAYISLEDLYCRLNITRAIQIAEPMEVQPNVFCSSMVEDTFFLVKKSLERTISTGSDQAIMAIFNRLVELFDPQNEPAEFYKNLQTLKKVEAHVEGVPKCRQAELDLFEALTQAVENDSLQNIDIESIAFQVNSIHVAISSISSMREMMSQYLDSSSPLVRTVLDDFDRILKPYKDLVDHLFGQLSEFSYVQGGLKASLLSTFGKANYELDVSSFEKASISMETIKKLVENITMSNIILKSCKNLMIPEPFHCIIEKVCWKIVESIEGYVKKKKFSEWGALLLQSEIRSLQQNMSNFLVSGTLRPQFERLLLISLLLNLDKPSDIQLHSNVLSLVLMKEEEIKSILLLRNDFLEDMVNSLKIDIYQETALK